MRVAIGSAFRNCSPNAPRYMERVAALVQHLPDLSFRVIAVEGDSVDNTRQALRIAADYHGVDLDLRTCNHGGRDFGSTEEPDRMVALSKVGNAIFDGVREDDGVLVYVESDLRWDPETIAEMIAQAWNREGGFDVFAPLVMAGPSFYDIWGFRGLDGRRFSPHYPFFPGLFPDEVRDSAFEVGSVGSCLVMRTEVARACRIRNDYCLVGWCEDARSQGYRIAVNSTLKVYQL